MFQTISNIVHTKLYNFKHYFFSNTDTENKAHYFPINVKDIVLIGTDEIQF